LKEAAGVATKSREETPKEGISSKRLAATK